MVLIPRIFYPHAVKILCENCWDAEKVKSCPACMTPYDRVLSVCSFCDKEIELWGSSPLKLHLYLDLHYVCHAVVVTYMIYVEKR